MQHSLLKRGDEETVDPRELVLGVDVGVVFARKLNQRVEESLELLLVGPFRIRVVEFRGAGRRSLPLEIGWVNEIDIPIEDEGAVDGVELDSSFVQLDAIDEGSGPGRREVVVMIVVVE